jgi:hypothetical protein
MTVKAKVFARIEAEQTNGDVSWTPLQQKAIAFADGTGVGQCNLVYARELTIASAAASALDLAGGVTDDLGNTLTFAELVAIIVINEAEDGTANTTDVTVGGGTNPFVGFWGTAGDQVVLKPGNFFLVGGSGAAGIGAVVPSTGDILRIANGAGATAQVQVMVLGRSA